MSRKTTVLILQSRKMATREDMDMAKKMETTKSFGLVLFYEISTIVG